MHTKFPEGLSPVEFVVGLKRLELLYQKAEAFIENYVGGIDAIEVHLALQVRLRKRLKLPVYAKDMLYFACSSLTQDDIDRIGEKVLTDTQDPATAFEGNKIWEEYINLSFGFFKQQPAELLLRLG